MLENTTDYLLYGYDDRFQARHPKVKSIQQVDSQEDVIRPRDRINAPAVDPPAEPGSITERYQMDQYP